MTGARVLVLSGGGSRGAWQAGALRYLTERGAEYDAAHGTSVGALNAVGMCQAARSYDAAQTVEARWLSLRGTGDVLRSRGPWLSAIAHESLYTVDPLRARLTEWVSSARIVKPCVAWSTDTATGSHTRHDLASATISERVRSMLASSSYPLAMLPVAGLRDGGLRALFALREALIEWPGAESIDVLVATSLDGPPQHDGTYGAGEELMRCVELLSYEVGESAKAKARVEWLEQRARGDHVPRVRWYWPRRGAPTPDPMRFERAEIESAIRAGWDDAREPVEVWQ